MLSFQGEIIQPWEMVDEESRAMMQTRGATADASLLERSVSSKGLFK
jgi:hypothetical protein